MKKRVVIVGNGMAGARTVAELVDRDPELSITVLGAEEHPAYNRTMLTEVLSGIVEEADIGLAEEQGKAEIETGLRALKIDRDKKVVKDAAGIEHSYDALVLATGGIPRMPDISGLCEESGELIQGAAFFHTLDDCRRILRSVTPGSRAVVLGGGLLGLETARALVTRGADVEVLHAGEVLMNRQLDQVASQILVEKLAGVGVTVRLGCTITAVAGDRRVQEVRLGDGTWIPCDLLVLSCGFAAATALAEAAELPIGAGVLVDQDMRTADPDIYAVGDCAEADGVVSGLVGEAWKQARKAAEAITGARDRDACLAHPPAATRLKAPGIELTVMGESNAPDGPNVHAVEDADHSAYRRIVLREGRISGAVVLGGEAEDATPFVEHYHAGTRLTRNKAIRMLHLEKLEEPVAGQKPEDAAVCYCNNVPQKTILEAWTQGATSIAAIARSTKATTGCGICRSKVEALLASAAAAE
ncbi:FAD-dependent oxidoreductase [Streptomyces sp. NPDC050315]|uniref:FAD-dependent oxidoreductase n=1 Tax=Streptomyces sp. NPDC050315 TaxID=3155039 RepID=UPI00343CACEE